MDSNYNVGFYNQYDLLVVELDHAIKVDISGTYLICSDDNNSVKFFVNTITLIEGPTFSQAYTPLNVGFYQQDSAYFTRLREINNFIQDNVVKVLFRDINALIFSDGTVQTTAATGGGGGGTVTSVGFTEGTGIDITGTNPITTSGTITITNTAPDQVVTLTDGTGIDVTGTYPSFTITNTAPDQTVVLTEGNGIDITGTYPNFTIASTGGSIPHGTAAGTDTYTTTITGVTAYNDADAYLIRFTNGNTTGATLNINSLGAIDLYRNNDGALIGGDIVDGAEMLCVYNSSTNRFQVIGTAPNTLLGYVTNADSVALTKGMPVYAFGGTGDRLTVKRANNSSDATSAQTIGLVLSTSIGVNQKGLIMMQGLLDGLNIVPTPTWADGDPVYLGDTAGTITKTKPYAPKHLVYLGFVTSASPGSAGRIYVKVQNGYELDELHNVQAQSPSLKDTLYYDNTVSPAQWKTASISTILGYTPGTVTSIATTAPILGGTITDTGTISIRQATSSTDGYLSSADWLTFNGKQDTITGAATTVTTTNLTANRAVISNGSGKIAVSTVTDTEVGYLSGLTSDIQTQLNAKQGTLTLTTTGTSGAATLVGSTLNIPTYAAANSGTSFITGVTALTSVGASTTLYTNFLGTSFVAIANENARQLIMPENCTLSRLYFRTLNTQSATGSLVITVRKNGVDTALVITIPAGSVANTFSNTTNSISFSAGDFSSVKVQNNATATSAQTASISIMVAI